jgi:hypothetical protein
LRLVNANAFLLVAAAAVLLSCRQADAAPFPTVDRGKLRISLTRSACYGTCPDYKVTIDGRGHVIFSTREDSLPGAPEARREFNPFPYVVAPGRREYRVDPKLVDALLQKFRDANFFELKDDYSAQITDNPTYAVVVDTGNGKKQVIDYVGRKAGMPAVVTQLEDAVDEVAQTGRWVSGANGLVEALEKERFDFHSEEAAQILVRSIETGGDQTHVELISRGAPLELPSPGGPYRTKGPFGSVALLTSIREGRATLFKELVRRGWLKRTNSQQVADTFVQSAAGCNPELADAAIAAGISVDTPSSHGGDGFLSEGGDSALGSLAQSYSCDDEMNRLGTASRLLELGANPNQRDDAGKTAIFGVENLELLNLLLANGANTEAIDNKGNSSVYDTWTDEIVLRLLQAGASLKGSYEGKTLWEQMKERPMPKVKAWLADHPAALAAAKSK